MKRTLVIALTCLTAAAWLILGEMGLALGLFALYFAMPFAFRVLAVVLFALIPLGPGFPVMGLRVTLIEILTPLLFAETVFTPRAHTGRTRSNFGRMVLAGLWFMILGLAFSYLRNPAGTANLFGGVGEGYGIRAYFAAIVCMMAFWIVWRAVSSGLVDGRMLIGLVAWASVAVGLLRIANYVGLIPQVPFFEGNLRYLTFEGGGFESSLAVTKRVGGLDQAGGFGLIASYSGWTIMRRRHMLLLAVLSAMILIYGGGRSAFVGAALALMTDVVSGGFRRALYALPVIGLAYLVLTSVQIQGQNVANPQFERLLKVMTGTRQIEEDAYRLEGYRALFEHWRRNPFIGSGIAAPRRGQIATISSFGGHGAIISLIGLFGLLGLGFLVLFVLVPLGRGAGALLGRRAMSGLHGSMIMKMAALLMIFVFVMMIGGGNGYADPHLYVTVALMLGSDTLLRASRRRALRASEGAVPD